MPDISSPLAAAANKLPAVSKTELLRRYRTRVDLAKRFRQKENLDDTWRRMVDLYRGKHYKAKSTEDQIVVNLAFSTINVIGPSVSTNHPKITVNARQPEDEAKATITEAVVNYWWRHYDFKPELRRAVDDWLTVGHGWLKVGYRYEEGERPLGEDEQQAQFTEATTQLDQFAMQNPEMAGDLPSNQDVAEALPTTETVPVKDCPFVERVSFCDVFVDPESTAVSDLKWIAQRITRPLEEVKADRRYPRRVRRDLKADSSVNREWAANWETEQSKSDLARVTLWEFYDLQRNTVCLFPELGDDFLIDPVAMPYTYGIPFVMLRNYDVPDQFYPIGELENLEPIQQELNKTRSQMVNYRKKDQRKYVYRPEAFDNNGIAALTSDVDNTLVPVIDANTPLTDLVAPIAQGNPFNAEMYQHSELIENDMDRISGVSEFQRGGSPDVRKTATEIAVTQDAANARSADKLSMVEEVIAEVAERLVQLAQQYMTGDKVARVVGMDGSKLWVPYSRDDISAEFDFEVEAGSTQPMNETFKRQQALQMMQVLTPFIGPVLDPAKMLLQVMRDGFGIKNAEQFLAPPPDPQSNAIAQGERIIETMNYKDLPPGAQMKLLIDAGLPPDGVAATNEAVRAQLESQVGLAQAEADRQAKQQQPEKKAA